MALKQILYVSSLRASGTDAISQILNVSLANNERRDITGMILYSEGNILQVLEGESEPLSQTFSSIEHDPRHSGLIVMFEKELEAREFGPWRMGFIDIKNTHLAGQADTFSLMQQLGKSPSGQAQSSQALELMKTFAKDYRVKH